MENKITISILASGQVILCNPVQKYRSRRSLGFISERTLQIKRNFTNQYIRIFQGFGYCYDLIAYHQNDFDCIAIATEKGCFYITPQELLKCGVPKQYNNLELQLFLNNKYLHSSRIEAMKFLEIKETPINSVRISDIQTNLF